MGPDFGYVADYYDAMLVGSPSLAPEPATILLLGLGIAVAMGWRYISIRKS